MLLYCPISLGELVDKITILEIKLEYIHDPGKRLHVQQELDLLREILQKTGTLSPSDELYQQLYHLNKEFWEYHDWQRERWTLVGQTKEIDEELYWKNAQEHELNDRRAQLKKDINLRYGSTIIEEKQFRHYQI